MTCVAYPKKEDSGEPQSKIGVSTMYHSSIGFCTNLVEVNRHVFQRNISNGDIERKDDRKGQYQTPSLFIKVLSGDDAQ